MTGLNHAATGALVAAAINEPLLSLPAALLSHFAVDVIPHWDYKVRGGLKARQKIKLIDLAASLVLLFLLTMTVVNAPAWLIFGGGLLGILPDAMWLRFFLTGKESFAGNKNSLINKLRKFHLKIQWSETHNGIYLEVVWFVLVMFLIYQI